MPPRRRRSLVLALSGVAVLASGQGGLAAQAGLGTNVSSAHIHPVSQVATLRALPSSAALEKHGGTGEGQASSDRASVPFQVETDWTKNRFDLSNSGYNPFEDVLDPSNIPSLQAAWSYPSGGNAWGTPALHGGVLYTTGVSHGTTISALDAVTGSLLWSRRMKHWGTLSGVNYHAGVLYFGTDNYVLHAIDAQTGAKRWDVPAGGIPTNVTVWDGMVYFQATDAAIHAVDAATGQEVWRFLGSALVGLGTPAIARGVLYEGNGQSLYALDARTGELVWSYETGGLIEASAALSKNTVFVASEDQYLYAINATTGALRWRVALGPPSFWQDQATAVSDGVVYACAQGTLQAFDAITGALRWKATSATYSGDPVVANGVVYVSGSSSGNLYAVDASDGTNLWTFATGPVAVSEPVVANGTVYFGTPELTAFSLP